MDGMERTDAALVEDCLSGRQESFAELVRRYQDPVFNLALRMTSNATEAADITQEVFLRGYRKLSTYRPEFAFRNWIMTICANHTKNRFRSEARRQRAEEALRVEQEIQAEGVVSGVKDVDPALEAALGQMPEDLRAALILKHVEGFSYEEIAGVLRIGLSAAKMRVKRGRDELVRLLQGSVEPSHAN